MRTTLLRTAILVIVAQACVYSRKGWPQVLDRSPCFVLVDTPIPAGTGEPSRSYVRLQSHPPSFLVGGNALEFFRDSALTQRTHVGLWESSGRDILRFDYWVVPTTIVTLRRHEGSRWTGEMTFGGDAGADGTPAIFHSRIDALPYRCPAHSD